MMDKEQLKDAVCAAIDRHADEIVGLGETILRHPETGFNEVKTSSLVAERMGALGLSPRTGLALTGVKGRLTSGRPGPRLAVIGELDSLRTSDHPHADPITGAAHSCGHNAQIAGMIGAAIGLTAVRATDHLAGEIVFFAVPAEEFIDVEERLGLVATGKIELMNGKPELIAEGHFDDIDMAMMIHTASGPGPRSFLCDSSNGAVVKQIRFIGKAAHAGAFPQLGINALSAAMIAFNAIAAQRETFWEKDTIRIHPIITKGGDAVSVVPAEVNMETFVRGGSLDAIMDANRKVDRCLRAGAMAMGAEVEIQTIPGYLPQRNNAEMGKLFGAHVATLFGPDQFRMGGHRTGSTDMGDLGHIMPTIHPYLVAAEGGIHSRDWRINEPQNAYIAPAKLLAMMAIELLYGDGKAAREILSCFKPAMTKSEYLAFVRAIFHKERYVEAVG